MLDRRLHPSLAADAVDEGIVVGELGPQDLERHATVQRHLNRLVDHAHAAAPEQPLDAIAAERSTDLDQGSPTRGPYDQLTCDSQPRQQR